MLAQAKAQWYAVPGKYVEAPALAETWSDVENKGSRARKAAIGRKGLVFSAKKLRLHLVVN